MAIRLNDNTCTVLSMLSEVTISNNKGKDRNWGVLFNSYRDDKGKLLDEAFSVSQGMVIRVSEFGEFTYDVGAPFYHYSEEGFMRNQMAARVEDVQGVISRYEFKQCVRIPYGNIINFIFNSFPDKVARSRVRCIIKVNRGEVPQDHQLFRFNDEGIFYSDLISKPVVVDKFSSISKEAFVPGRMYVCQIINENNDFYLANLKKEYFKGVQIGLYETVGGGFFPETESELYNFDNYPQGRVLSIPFILEGDYLFEPVHIDCNLLFESLKLFKGGFEWVDMWVGGFSKHPIMVTGYRESADFPKIECFIAPKDPAVRGDVN